MTKDIDKKPMSPRAGILVKAVNQVHKDKDELYGDPAVNLACAGELKRTFLKYAARSPRRIGPAEHEAIDQALSRIARVATGQRPLEASYTSAAGYLAVAGELAFANQVEVPEVMNGEEDQGRPEEAMDVGLTEAELTEKILLANRATMGGN